MDKSMQTMRALVKNYQHTNEQKPPTQSIDRTNPMNAKWVWEQMTDIWGEQWMRERGEQPSTLWIMELSLITNQHLKRGVGRVLSDRLAWPPSLPQFLSLCLDFDTTDAFKRMIDGVAAKDDVEYYTRADVSFRCKRQLPEDKARNLFDKVFKRKLDLKRQGKLPPRDQKLLSCKSVVTETDKAITDRGNGGSKIEIRMANIIKNKKN